jgi:hypothetical protein
MKVNLTFNDDCPRLSIYGLEGTILKLSGRTVYIVTQDIDLSARLFFFVEQQENGWQFCFRSNAHYSQSEMVIINNLLDKANQAIVQKQSVELSQEFNAIDKFEPYDFGGLFTKFTERYDPIFECHDPNLGIEKMRKKLETSMSTEEIQADAHLRQFINNAPSEIIWIDSSNAEGGFQTGLQRGAE